MKHKIIFSIAIFLYASLRLLAATPVEDYLRNPGPIKDAWFTEEVYMEENLFRETAYKIKFDPDKDSYAVAVYAPKDLLNPNATPTWAAGKVGALYWSFDAMNGGRSLHYWDSAKYPDPGASGFNAAATMNRTAEGQVMGIVSLCGAGVTRKSYKWIEDLKFEGVLPSPQSETVKWQFVLNENGRISECLHGYLDSKKRGSVVSYFYDKTFPGAEFVPSRFEMRHAHSESKSRVILTIHKFERGSPAASALLPTPLMVSNSVEMVNGKSTTHVQNPKAKNYASKPRKVTSKKNGIILLVALCGVTTLIVWAYRRKRT